MSTEIVDVVGAFSDADKTVVNWEGQNYYAEGHQPDAEPQDPEDFLITTQGTMQKVYEALGNAGLEEVAVINCVNEMQNNGIKFRELIRED